MKSQQILVDQAQEVEVCEREKHKSLLISKCLADDELSGRRGGGVDLSNEKTLKLPTWALEQQTEQAKYSLFFSQCNNGPNLACRADCSIFYGSETMGVDNDKGEDKEDKRKEARAFAWRLCYPSVRPSKMNVFGDTLLKYYCVHQPNTRFNVRQSLTVLCS